jgi:hypothetical protein
MLQYWKSANNLEKKLIKQYGFTLCTPNDVSVGLDFGHKRYVNLTRKKSGKVYHYGHEAKIEHAALCCM